MMVPSGMMLFLLQNLELKISLRISKISLKISVRFFHRGGQGFLREWERVLGFGERVREKGGMGTSAKETAKRPDGKWREALAGAWAGAVARTTIAPLDVIKIRFQVQREAVSSSSSSSSPSSSAAAAAVLGGAQRSKAVGKYRGVVQALTCVVKEEGVVGLWRGTVPGLLLTIPYTAVQFFTLETFKSATAKYRTRNQTERKIFDSERLLSFVGGACAGVAATAASYPFDVLRTTMAAQGVPRQYPTMLHAARGLVAKRGVLGGMYAGIGVTIVEIIPYAALQFGLYDIFTTLYDRADRAEGSRSQADTGRRTKVDWSYLASKPFLCGLASGFIAKFATHPLDVVKKRYQVAGLTRSSSYGKGFGVQEVAVLGILKLLSRTMKEEGLHGIYKGVTPSLLKSAPSAAITFAMYSMALEYINKVS